MYRDHCFLQYSNTTGLIGNLFFVLVAHWDHLREICLIVVLNFQIHPRMWFLLSRMHEKRPTSVLAYASYRNNLYYNITTEMPLKSLTNSITKVSLFLFGWYRWNLDHLANYLSTVMLLHHVYIRILNQFEYIYIHHTLKRLKSQYINFYKISQACFFLRVPLWARKKVFIFSV